MKVAYYHYIKSINLPDGWLEVESIEGGANAQTVRSFAPDKESSARIEFFYRGLPLSKKAAADFRSVLKSGPSLIFDQQNKKDIAAIELQTVSSLEEALGNAGNNQLVNKLKGRMGPPFMLERLEVLLWKNRCLLAARGYFNDPEKGTRINNFCGFFIDAKPGEPKCRVEEIYLQVKEDDLYLKYLPSFQKSLTTLEWRS